MLKAPDSPWPFYLTSSLKSPDQIPVDAKTHTTFLHLFHTHTPFFITSPETIDLPLHNKKQFDALVNEGILATETPLKITLLHYKKKNICIIEAFLYPGSP